MIGSTTVTKSDQSTTSKILSFCLFGRDDNYMLDFHYRITTTINHIARSLKQLDRLDDVEILVIDWGSDIPMAQTLDLSSEGAKITRFIYIPLELIRATQGGNSDFHTSRAANVAIRRAIGSFIIIYPADALIPQYSLSSLIRLIEGKILNLKEVEQTYFLIPRYQVPWQYMQRTPSLDEWDRYFLVSNKKAPLEPVDFCMFGNSGALMMHHSMWHALRGLDENMTKYGWIDMDLGLRVSQLYPYLSLSSIGIFIYHMGHPPIGRRQSAVKNVNAPIYNSNFQVNDENWGFGEIKNLEIQDPQKFSLSKKISPVKYSLPLKSWDQYRDNIQIEFQKGDISEIVKSEYAAFLLRSWKINPPDLNALFLLTWYSCHHFPRRYLEFAAGRSPGSGVVAAGCPSVEIYKVDTWEGVMPDNTPYDLVLINEFSSFSGYLRFINGDIGTAIQRLKKSVIGTFFFDLVFIKEEDGNEDVLKTIFEILPYLASEGALVFTSYSKKSFISYWKKIQETYPDFVYISCSDQQTGIIIKVSFEKTSNELFRIEEISFDIGWISGIKRNNLIVNVIKKLPFSQSITKVIKRLVRNANQVDNWAKTD